jgi:hypothetical protein
MVLIDQRSPRQRNMVEDADRCPSCGTWHAPPIPCAFDPEKRCRCGGRLGPRWTGDDGRAVVWDGCWNCWHVTRFGFPAQR